MHVVCLIPPLLQSGLFSILLFIWHVSMSNLIGPLKMLIDISLMERVSSNAVPTQCEQYVV